MDAFRQDIYSVPYITIIALKRVDGLKFRMILKFIWVLNATFVNNLMGGSKKGGHILVPKK